MSITIERDPEAKFEDLANPETNKTSEVLEAIKELDKGHYVLISGEDENPRGLSRRITVAIKKFRSTADGKRADFETKRTGTAEWAVMRKN